MTAKKHVSKTDRAIVKSSVMRPLVCLALAILLASLGASIANIALPTLTQSLEVSFSQVQWVVIAYLVAITATIVGVGRIADLFGYRRILLIGLSIFVLASLACAGAATLWWLVVSRVVQGIGAAVLMVIPMAMVREIGAQQRTGRMMGLLGSMSAIGTALGPSLGGVLVSSIGWRSIFLLLVVLGVINMVMVCFFLPSDQWRTKQPEDSVNRIGTVLLALCLTAYALTLTIGGGHFSQVNLWLFLATIALAGGFILHESKTTAPIIRIQTFANFSFSISLMINALVASVMMSTLVIGPFYLTLAQNINEAQVGMIMAVGPLVSAFSGIPAGRLVDRLGAKPMTLLGLACIASGAGMLATLPLIFGIPGYLGAMLMLTPGYQLFLAANNTNVMVGVGENQRGVISGLLNLSRNLGLLTGASAMGALFAFSVQAQSLATASPAQVSHGMQVTFGAGQTELQLCYDEGVI